MAAFLGPIGLQRKPSHAPHPTDTNREPQAQRSRATQSQNAASLSSSFPASEVGRSCQHHRQVLSHRGRSRQLWRPKMKAGVAFCWQLRRQLRCAGS
ncbi:hypothetical protein Pcinc_014293 [Petrolisthes cinctipes]|uniref:Uncharacterized protein n=1 Tax=Petrolisthes cinctipes TaxID=88211 RepID=A0AAE1FWQ1_PETCI|nr:hypothetical protein Pcinc_014293 [Petrolisthes cinctipes]